MDSNDLTIEILKSIRDEVRGTNSRVDHLTGRVDHLTGRVDELVERVDRTEKRQIEMEIRLGTELVAVTGAIREVRDLLREDRALRERVEDHERRVRAIEKRLG